MNYQVKNIYGKIKNKSVSVSVPGSKSITARALLIAAVAKGESTLYGVQFSDDCATFLTCLKDLGIDCRVDGNTVKIVGCGGKQKLTWAARVRRQGFYRRSSLFKAGSTGLTAPTR